MNRILLLSLLALGYQTASAQLVTESFGSGANAFTMDFVTIGNPGNAADTTGVPNPAGAVSYVYSIGKHEISRDIISRAINNGLSGVDLGDMNSFGGNGINKPATRITLNEALRFVNFLNTSKGFSEAYKPNGDEWSSTESGYNPNNSYRNSNAFYFLPTVNEWYKAAYFDPLNSVYYNVATGSDSPPASTSGGTSPNSAVYGLSYNTGPSDVFNAGGLSPYGTMAQSGNVNEWLEISSAGSYARGGWWNSSPGNEFNLGVKYDDLRVGEDAWVGFRVASVPEPSSLSLLALGGLVVAVRRRKK